MPLLLLWLLPFLAMSLSHFQLINISKWFFLMFNKDVLSSYYVPGTMLARCSRQRSPPKMFTSPSPECYSTWQKGHYRGASIKNLELGDHPGLSRCDPWNQGRKGGKRVRVREDVTTKAQVDAMQVTSNSWKRWGNGFSPSASRSNPSTAFWTSDLQALRE